MVSLTIVERLSNRTAALVQRGRGRRANESRALRLEFFSRGCRSLAFCERKPFHKRRTYANSALLTFGVDASHTAGPSSAHTRSIVLAMPKHLSQEFVDSDDDRSSPRADRKAKGKVRPLVLTSLERTRPLASASGQFSRAAHAMGYSKRSA